MYITNNSAVGLITKISDMIQEQVYTQIFLNCHLAAFLHGT